MKEIYNLLYSTLFAQPNYNRESVRPNIR